MNGKKIACVVLMLVAAVFAYASQILQKKARTMEEERDGAQSIAFAASTSAQAAANHLKRMEHDTQDLREFLEEWKPVISRLQSGQEAEQALVSLVRNSGILIVSQKFEMKENRSNTFMPKIFQANLTVQDEYSKTLNWLGQIERQLPMARVNFCRLTQGETGRQLNVEMRLEIPIINFAPEKS